MPISAPTLAGQTLAHPNEYKRPRGYRGGRQIMADGSMVTDLVSTTAKHSWELSWNVLTDAQRVTLQTAFDAIKDTSGTYVDIDGTSYTVTLAEDFEEIEFEAVKKANGPFWRTSLRLRQV